MAKTDQTTLTFSYRHTLRLSTFQIGSAMGDILVTSIWNRVMITNFGIPATPVSLLIALRYLLSPLSLWAGFLSDNKPLWGMKRTSYIWLGRFVMILSLPFLGLSLVRLGQSQSDALGWLFALVSALLYGVGTLVSGSPYLALVRDSAPKQKQGLAISIAETVLIICFALTGIIFSIWLKVYEEPVFWEMVLATMLVGGFFWFFAIAGAEKRIRKSNATYGQQGSGSADLQWADMRRKLAAVWRDPRARGFFYFLSLATVAAWAQDAILEPFGAETFLLPLSRTTRFNAYWQTATVITLIASSLIWRKRPPEAQGRVTMGGLLTMTAGMLLLSGASLAGQVRLLEPALFLFGAGFGVYTFGGFSLMAAMTTDRDAGVYLGLWTIAVLLAKGVGTFMGGAARDLFILSLGLSPGAGYGLVFALSALGLAVSVYLLMQIDILGFARDTGRLLPRADVQAAGLD